MCENPKFTSPQHTQHGNLHLFSQEKSIPETRGSHKECAEQSDPSQTPETCSCVFAGRGFPLVTPALTCINCLNPISLQFKLNMTVSLENMAYFLLLVSF